MSLGPYAVKMFFRVMDDLNDEVLIAAPDAPETVLVQPPAWCVDDPVVLDMHLELGAKHKKLCELRKAVANDDPAYAMLKGRRFTVRGHLYAYAGQIN